MRKDLKHFEENSYEVRLFRYRQLLKNALLDNSMKATIFITKRAMFTEDSVVLKKKTTII